MCTKHAQEPAYKAGRPHGRPTVITQLLGAASRSGSRLTGLARSTGRSTEGTTIKNMTVAPVDQTVDWKVKIDLSHCQRLFCFGAYIKGSSLAVFNKDFRSKFSHLYKCISSKFLKSFCAKKVYLLFIFKS